MNIRLSDRFNYKMLLKFTIPSVIMMIFISVYGVIDGLFVSNVVGKTPFAAVNFIMPVLMLLGVLGFMFGTGGSALIAKSIGEGKEEKANELFSFFVYISIGLGIIIAIISGILLRKIGVLLGGEGTMLDDAVLYGRLILIGLPFLMLQYEFQSFFVVAEKPQLGLIVTIISGVTNMLLDALFMVVFKWGIVGAALATAISQIVGGVIPLLYFIGDKNSSLLRIGKPKCDLISFIRTCFNGSSELMTNISISVVSMLYNIQLLRFAGENGIAAYGVLMYINFVFLAIFIGYITGVAPVISYHFGAGNNEELTGLLKKSLVLISVFAIMMFIVSESLSYPLSYFFVGYDNELMTMTLRGFRIYSFSFIFAGFSIFGSGFFTALNDGLTSSVLSFLRTLLFQIAAILILPVIWKLDGIWFSVVVAEGLAFILTFILLLVMRKKYNY